MNKVRLLLGTFLCGVLLWSGSLWAGAFPKGCEPRDYRYSNDHLILNESGDQHIFVIYNRANMPVVIQRYQANELLMSPSLSVTLEVGNWSAFASDLQNLPFECQIKQGEGGQKVNCAQVLEVCEYPRAKFALSNMGNYWVSANKSQRDVINDAAAKGIYLHW